MKNFQLLGCKKFITVKWLAFGVSSLLLATAMYANDRNQPHENTYYQVTEIEPNLVEIRNPHTGDVTYKNTSEQVDVASPLEVPEMLINVANFDFEFYADRYVHWQNVHVWNTWSGLLIADTDQDGRKEIIGDRNYVSSNIPPGEPKFHAIIMELTDENTFQLVHDYPDSTHVPFWAGDIDDDWKQEVVLAKLSYNDSLIPYKLIQNYEALTSSDFSTEFNHEYYRVPFAQPNHVNIIDFDSDQQQEMIYFLSGGEHDGDTCASSTVITEYDSNTNQFQFKYCFQQPAFYTSHYAFADWDMDGHMEFATGGLDGEMYIVEATGPDTYELVYEDTLDTYNAYLSTSTNDMNGNGKPELWIGGDRSGSGTTIFCFESIGNNEYENVFKFRLPGVFSFDGYGIVNTDIDQDGVDELMIWTAGFIFILKNNGPESYEVIYAHQNNAWDGPSYRLYSSVTSKDVSGDGYPELLISLSTGLEEDTYYFTEIYQPTGPLLKIEQVELPSSYQTLTTYPNPFNNSVMIQWPYIGNHNVSMEIFDIRGRLVHSVEFPTSSKHQKSEYQWNATSNLRKEVTSGIFIIKVANFKTQFITKVVLLE